MIISVHIPKTGGISFKEILQNGYGKKIVSDNTYLKAPTPFERQFAIRTHRIKRCVYTLRGIECIHGHFMPFKYSAFLQDSDVQFITWLRDPAERIISHYYYWKRTPNINPGLLRRRVEAENWSLEKFCLSEELRNRCAQYLQNFPIENFEFIGITEHYEEDATYFMERYFKKNINQVIPKANTNPDKSGKYAEKISPDFLKELQEFHAEDYALYRYALQKRAERVSSQ